MTVLRFIVPLAVIVYFLVKTKKSLVYVCAWPMLWLFGKAMYLPVPTQIMIRPFPVPIHNHDISMFLLGAAWLYVREKRPNHGKLTWGFDLFSVWLLLFVYVLQPFAIAIGQGFLHEQSVLNSRIYYYVPLAVLIWTDLLRRFTREEIWLLLRSIAFITGLLMPLFILSSMGVKVFPDPGKHVYYTGSALIVRDILTYPFWTSLAVAVYFVRYLKNELRTIELGILALLVAGSILTLTRSTILLMALGAIVASGVSLIRLRMLGKTAPKMLTVGFVIISSIFLTTLVFPEHYEFFEERFALARDLGLNAPNLKWRIQGFSEAVDYIDSIDPVFGVGVPGCRQVVYDETGLPLADSGWVTAIFFTGWSGFLALVLCLTVMSWNALKLSFNRDSDHFWMGLLLLMVLLNDIGKNSVGPIFFWYSTSIALPLALTMIERRNLWAINPVTRPRIRYRLGFNPTRIAANSKYAPLWRFAYFAGLVYFSYKVGLMIVR